MNKQLLLCFSADIATTDNINVWDRVHFAKGFRHYKGKKDCDLYSVAVESSFMSK